MGRSRYVPWFVDGPYMDFFRYMDGQAGWWLYRWGDHAIRTMGVAMHMREAEIAQFDIAYAHQHFCKCSTGPTQRIPQILKRKGAVWNASSIHPDFFEQKCVLQKTVDVSLSSKTDTNRLETSWECRPKGWHVCWIYAMIKILLKLQGKYRFLSGGNVL